MHSKYHIWRTTSLCPDSLGGKEFIMTTYKEAKELFRQAGLNLDQAIADLKANPEKSLREIAEAVQSKCWTARTAALASAATNGVIRYTPTSGFYRKETYSKHSDGKILFTIEAWNGAPYFADMDLQSGDLTGDYYATKQVQQLFR